MSGLVVQARSIITMNPEVPRAQAVAVSDGRIVAVGSAVQCHAALPDAEVCDLGDVVLMPGFVEPHSHPFLSGVGTQSPAHWIAPWFVPTYGDVVKLWTKLNLEAPSGEWLLFNGLDRLLHGCDAPTTATLDPIFPDRPVLILNNSGHAAYCNSAMLQELGWIDNPPADPPAGSFGRYPDGSLNGIAEEVPAIMMTVAPAMANVIKRPLYSAAKFYHLMARGGITSTSDMTFSTDLLQGYEALASMPSSPLRVSLYHMSTYADCGDEITSRVCPDRLRKQGIKLWADGSPWVGNVALSFPYLNSAVVQHAHIPLETGGEKAMNYTRAELDDMIAEHIAEGWQMSFHVNGDVALDVVLDAYEHALVSAGLLGTDHRWRIEHVGAGRPGQLDRAASLGVVASLGAFQFYYWGDLLDGELFASEIGSQWQPFRAAFDAGVHPSFHNDGSVSPPSPLINVQTAITRQTSSGTVRGANQCVSIDEALRAVTINGAYALKRDDEIGSIEVGKFADFVELSSDPYEVDPATLATSISVIGTWLDGERIDLDQFLAAVVSVSAPE